MNIMTFVSTELPTHCLYINVYAELPTQVERYFTTLRFIFFDKRILYYVSRSLHRVDTIILKQDAHSLQSLKKVQTH